jgi:type I restriction enzyme, S subunit
MGKLVPQDPNDEPVSELLEKIAKEKARLIKEGKIKKLEALLEIINDEKAFTLPEGWAWALIPQVVTNDKYSIKSGPFGSSQNRILCLLVIKFTSNNTLLMMIFHLVITI